MCIPTSNSMSASVPILANSSKHLFIEPFHSLINSGDIEVQIRSELVLLVVLSLVNELLVLSDLCLTWFWLLYFSPPKFFFIKDSIVFPTTKSNMVGNPVISEMAYPCSRSSWLKEAFPN